MIIARLVALLVIRVLAYRRRLLPNWSYQMGAFGAKYLSDGAKDATFLQHLSAEIGLRCFFGAGECQLSELEMKPREAKHEVGNHKFRMSMQTAE